MKTLTVIHRKSIPFLLLVLILISALLVVCLPNAKAQDLTQFISESGFLSLSYPADWTLVVDENDTVHIANSESAIADMEQLQAGDIHISIALIPTAVVEAFGSSADTSGPALEFVMNVPVHALVDPDNTSVGDISPAELGNGFDASQINISNTAMDGVIFAIMPTDGVVAYVTVVTPSGEYSNSEGAVQSILETLQYNGTAEDLWDELIGWPLPI